MNKKAGGRGCRAKGSTFKTFGHTVHDAAVTICLEPQALTRGAFCFRVRVHSEKSITHRPLDR